MKNICKEVPKDLALFSSFVFKKSCNLTVSLFKKYSYTNSSQKVLVIVLLENTIYITCEFFPRITNGRKCILCTNKHFLRLIFHHPELFLQKHALQNTHKSSYLKHDFNTILPL